MQHGFNIQVHESSVVDMDSKYFFLAESRSYPVQNKKKITIGKYSHRKIKIAHFLFFYFGEVFSRILFMIFFLLVLEALLASSRIRILKNHAPEADFKCAGWGCWAGQFSFSTSASHPSSMEAGGWDQSSTHCCSTSTCSSKTEAQPLPMNRK